MVNLILTGRKNIWVQIQIGGLIRYCDSGRFLLFASIFLVKCKVWSLMETGTEEEVDECVKKGGKCELVFLRSRRFKRENGLLCNIRVNMRNVVLN